MEKISLSKPNDMKQLEVIQSKIYDIRGQKVMIDRDLAEMYGVETRTLNQAVKRNVDRFPEDFMFQLTDEETQNWKSQIVITNSVKMGIPMPLLNLVLQCLVVFLIQRLRYK